MGSEQVLTWRGERGDKEQWLKSEKNVYFKICVHFNICKYFLFCVELAQ